MLVCHKLRMFSLCWSATLLYDIFIDHHKAYNQTFVVPPHYWTFFRRLSNIEIFHNLGLLFDRPHWPILPFFAKLEFVFGLYLVAFQSTQSILAVYIESL